MVGAEEPQQEESYTLACSGCGVSIKLGLPGGGEVGLGPGRDGGMICISHSTTDRASNL